MANTSKVINQINSDFVTDESNPLFEFLANANKNYFSYTEITEETFSPTINFDVVSSNSLFNQIAATTLNSPISAIETNLSTSDLCDRNHHISNNDLTDTDLIPQAAASYTNGIEALIGTNYWTSQTITYSFMSRVPDYYAGNAQERNQFIAFNETQQAAARRALQLYSEVSGLKFVEVSDTGAGGTIRFGTANIEHGSAHAYLPNNDPIGGDVWLNNSYSPNLTQNNGSDGFHTLIHEIGHALGLKHPGNYNAGGGGAEGPIYTLI